MIVPPDTFDELALTPAPSLVTVPELIVKLLVEIACVLPVTVPPFTFTEPEILIAVPSFDLTSPDVTVTLVDPVIVVVSDIKSPPLILTVPLLIAVPVVDISLSKILTVP